jgi:hypothetical protein
LNLKLIKVNYNQKVSNNLVLKINYNSFFIENMIYFKFFIELYFNNLNINDRLNKFLKLM